MLEAPSLLNNLGMQSLTPYAPVPRYAPVTDDWRQWIAENRLRNCTPESMCATMVASGLDPQECQQAISRMEGILHLELLVACRRFS